MFEVGDKITIMKPDGFFPVWWANHLKETRAPFGITQAEWDEVNNNTYTIAKAGLQYHGAAGVQLVLPGTRAKYIWPIVFMRSVDTKSPCDCSMRLLQSQGCQVKNHC